jgi:hypothetical protein
MEILSLFPSFTNCGSLCCWFNAIIFKALKDTTSPKKFQGSKGFVPPNNPFVKILMINVIFRKFLMLPK